MEKLENCSIFKQQKIREFFWKFAQKIEAQDLILTLLGYYLCCGSLTAFVRMSKKVISALVEKWYPRIFVKGINLPLIIRFQNQFPHTAGQIVWVSKQISFVIKNKSKLPLSFNCNNFHLLHHLSHSIIHVFILKFLNE